MVDLSFTLIAQVFNFLVLLVILYVFLFKNLVKFLDERAEGIRKDIEEATEKNMQATALVAEYEKKIVEAKKEAEQYFNQAKSEAESEKSRILRSAEEESNRIVKRTREDINAEYRDAKAKLVHDFSGLSVKCAEQILGREVNEKEHEKLIKEFLETELGPELEHV